MGAREQELVRLERRGEVAWIWLARPQKRNALTTATFQQIVGSLDDVEADPDVRCVVLAAEGPVFCAGQDLRFTNAASGADYEAYGRWNLQARRRLQHSDKPVVARVQGHAFGGGLLLATACDLVVVAAEARLGMPEIKAGAHAGGYHLLSIGRARALELCLLGRPLTAAEAEAWGLVNRVVPDERLDETVDDLTGQLCALPPLGITYTKRAMNLHLDLAGASATQDAGAVMQRYLGASRDSREAKRAFAEGRAPRFTGELPAAPDAP